MNPIYVSRRRNNIIVKFLCLGAALFGVTWLALILFTLFYNGLAGINLAVFTQDTPPPGSTDGGLRNAIVGSIMMTVIGVGIGAPLGLFAGTYLAEYGKHDKLTSVIRFINDILLSAPSIIIGLFIYGAIVVPMGGFSAFAGCLALAVIVIPVVVRTTEDMLGLVPNPLREAASALGLPRSLVIRRIAYRAARVGPDHRRAAGDRPRRRRNRAAAVHRAVQPVLQPRHDQDDGEPAGHHQQLRPEPLCLLEAARLERGAPDHAHRTCPEYWRAHSRRREDIQMTELSVSVSSASGPVPQVALPEAAPKVTARGLNFYYGEHHALKNINLTLGTHRVTAFIGPSGCGKSTLLRIFNRMYDLYPGQKATGQLMLDQTNILDPKLDLNLLRARVGMVFQKPTPFPMTIYENIAFGIRLYEKISKSEMDGRVEKALRGGALWNEVKDKLNASGLSLSGGQQQRLCIARTVAVRPEVILFDEPCSALDPISTAKIEELIQELAEDYTIAIVTHNMQQAARVSDKTAFMYLGELIEFDDTNKIFTSPSDRRTQDYITGRFG